MPTTRTTRRTKGAVLAPVYDDPMPRKQRSRATSVASSQRSNERSHDPAPAFNALSRLTSHNEELAAENDDLRRELEQQKTKRWTLRDKQLASQIAEHRIHQSVEPESAPIEQSKQTPVRPAQKLAEDTPAKSPPPPTTTPTSLPRWRQLLTSFTGFTPFSSRKIVEPATEPPKKTEQLSPLGQLPQNRKRSAPSADEEDTAPAKRTRTPEKQEQEPAPPRAPPSASKPLEAISEQPEPAQQKRKTAGPATPTRASRRRTPRTPQTEKPDTTDMPPATSSASKRRTIREARQSREASTSLLGSQSARPAKRWDAPIKPKEPNADKRLARMQQLEKLRLEKQKMEEEIARLAQEQEADGIDTRKRKRVKVDELTYIPHNQPGDAVGTFRVPDWDSDDEMEVDDEVPVRKNVFAANAEQQSRTTTTSVPLKPAAPSEPASLFARPEPKSSLPPASLFKPAAPTASTPPPSGEKTQPEQFKAPISAPSAKPLFSLPAETTTTPVSAPPAKPLFSPPAEPITKASAPVSAAVSTTPKKSFAWPSVGSKPAGDVWPEQKRISAGQKFARGFEAWSSITLQAH